MEWCNWQAEIPESVVGGEQPVAIESQAEGPHPSAQQGEPFGGLFKFCIVGTFPGLSQSAVEERIRAAGGLVISAPSARTDFAVMGQHTYTRKLQRVLYHSVPQISLAELDGMIAGEIWWDFHKLHSLYPLTKEAGVKWRNKLKGF